MKNREDNELERFLTNSRPKKDLGYFKSKLQTAKLRYKLTKSDEDHQEVLHYSDIVNKIEFRIFKG